VSSKLPRSPSSVTKFPPIVPDRWSNKWPIYRTALLPKLSASFVASWECSTFIDDFCHKLLLLKHHYTTFSPAPESKVLIPLPGRRNSTRPSRNVRKACHVPRYWLTPNHPRNLHSSRTPPLLPWVKYFNNACQPLAFFSKKLNSTQAEIELLRSRIPSCLRGRNVFPPHAGSTPLHHLHGSQTNHLRLPAEMR
jgi:hypothetical protein